MMNPKTAFPSVFVLCLMFGSVTLAPAIIQNGTRSQSVSIIQNGTRSQSVSETLSRFNPAKPWLIEGDIAVKMDGRKIIKSAGSHWPSAHVFYTFASALPNSVRRTIRAAMASYEASTCVRFFPRTSQANYVRFKNNEEGCWSYVGMIGGRQDLNIGDGCNYASTVLHEIGHAVGMFHEQSRPDRDQYITILTQNVNPEYRDNFNIATESVTLNVPYDFLSIMHYDQYAFAIRRNLVTIRAKPAYAQFQNTMGSGQVLTANDIAIIKKVYCQSSSTTTSAPATPPIVPPPSWTSTTAPPGPITTPGTTTYITCVGEKQVTVHACQTLTIVSKNYPNSYDKNMKCRIRLLPAANTKLNIMVTENSIDFSFGCPDLLSIEPDRYSSVYRVCNSPYFDQLSNYQGTDGPVDIKFKSDGYSGVHFDEQNKFKIEVTGVEDS